MRPLWNDLWDDLWQRSMPSPDDAAARHTGAGVARRQVHHERMRDERSGSGRGRRGASAGGRRGLEMESAAKLLDSVAEVNPNYTLLRSKETKAMRRKRKREDARLLGYSTMLGQTENSLIAQRELVPPRRGRLCRSFVRAASGTVLSPEHPNRGD